MGIETTVRLLGCITNTQRIGSRVLIDSMKVIYCVAAIVFAFNCIVATGTEEPVLPSSPNSLSDSFVFIEGGELPAMGNGRISVSSFYIHKYAVTNSEWMETFAQRSKYGYVFANDEYFGAGTNHPVVNVNWYDCIKWCNLRSEIEGKRPVYLANGSVYRRGNVDAIVVDSEACGYRLPTDAEWEFAARGGAYSKGYVYSGSDELDDVGWYRGNSIGAEFALDAGRGTWPVGLKIPNELGLYDMSGNVWEWCYDWHPDYVGLLRVQRGGDWKHFAAYCRVDFRYYNGPKYGSSTIGFRLATEGARGDPEGIQGDPAASVPDR